MAKPHCVKSNGMKQSEGVFQDTCLIDAFRSVGVRTPYLKDGPFWALADGAAMLAPFG